MEATTEISRTEITNTDFFKSLTSILQKITLQRTNVLTIIHGYNVCNNVGYERWNAITNTRYSNRMIVKELIENNA